MSIPNAIAAVHIHALCAVLGVRDGEVERIEIGPGGRT